MFQFTAQALYRALDVAGMPALKATHDARPALHHVQGVFTDQGLIFTATDRYHAVRTVAAYEGEAPTHGQGAPEVLIHREGLKRLLPMLKAAKSAPATVEADADAVVFTVGGQSMRLENAAGDGMDFPRVEALFRLHQNATHPPQAEPFVSLSPEKLQQITTVVKRHTGRAMPLHLSLDRFTAGKPVSWMLGDWAVGMLMPVRNDGPCTHESEARRDDGGLSRLFSAVPLMEAPDAAPTREDSAEVAAARATTRGTQASVLA